MASESDMAGPLGIMLEQLTMFLHSVRDDLAVVLDQKLFQLKRELADDQVTTNVRLANKLRLEKPPVFKKKSTEKQFVFNESVANIQ